MRIAVVLGIGGLIAAALVGGLNQVRSSVPKEMRVMQIPKTMPSTIRCFYAHDLGIGMALNVATGAEIPGMIALRPAQQSEVWGYDAYYGVRQRLDDGYVPAFSSIKTRLTEVRCQRK